jgi:uncharacterized protein involved in exopolysaccharide biosynthesis
MLHQITTLQYTRDHKKIQYSLKYYGVPHVGIFLLTTSLATVFTTNAMAANNSPEQVSLSQPQDLKKPCEDYQKEKIFLESQLSESEANVREAENNIRTFREKHQITDLDAESASSIKTINYLSQEITVASNQLTVVKSRIAKMQAIFAPKQIEGSLLELQSSGLQESMIIDYVKADIQRVALQQRINAFEYIVGAYRAREKRLPELKQAHKQLNQQWAESLIAYKKSYAQLDKFQIDDLESQFKNPQAAQKALGKEFIKKATKIQEYQEKTRDHRRKYQSKDTASEAVQILQRINKINIDITIVSAQLASQRYTALKIRQLLGGDILSIQEVAMMSEYSKLQDIINDLQEARRRFALERSRFGDSHPSVISLQRKILALDNNLKRGYGKYLSRTLPNIKTVLQKKLVVEYIQSETQQISLGQQVDASLKVAQAYRDRANSLPKIEQIQRELDRQLEVSLISYKDLVVRLQNPNRPFGRASDCRKMSN